VEVVTKKQEACEWKKKKKKKKIKKA